MTVPNLMAAKTLPRLLFFSGHEGKIGGLELLITAGSPGKRGTMGWLECCCFAEMP